MLKSTNLVGLLGLTTLFANVLALTPAFGAEAKNHDAKYSDAKADVKEFLQAYVKTKQLDVDSTARYLFAFVDLNGDGKEEVIVYLVGRWWCGSGGCTTFILEKTAGSYQLVTRITITELPIRVLDFRVNGWRSIGVMVKGGALEPTYEAVLTFDGKSYPHNPSLVTRRHGFGGKVVIKDMSASTPLLP